MVPMPSTSASELLRASLSMTPAGVAMLATSVRVPLPEPATAEAFTVKTALAPSGRLTSALMLPLPLAVPQVPPPEPAQVHEIPVSWAGNVSVTRAPVTAVGPPLLAVTV